MKRTIQLFLLLSVLTLNVSPLLAQGKITEKEMVGNWVLTGGSGEEFDREMIGDIFTFEKDHSLTKVEKSSGEKEIGDWTLDANILTMIAYYSDDKNDPEKDVLTVTQFDGKKLYLFYEEDDFSVVLERTSVP